MKPQRRPFRAGPGNCPPAVRRVPSPYALRTCSDPDSVLATGGCTLSELRGGLPDGCRFPMNLSPSRHSRSCQWLKDPMTRKT